MQHDCINLTWPRHPNTSSPIVPSDSEPAARSHPAPAPSWRTVVRSPWTRRRLGYLRWRIGGRPRSCTSTGSRLCPAWRAAWWSVMLGCWLHVYSRGVWLVSRDQRWFETLYHMASIKQNVQPVAINSITFFFTIIVKFNNNPACILYNTIML